MVLWPNPTSKFLARFAVRRHSRATLDLGTGSGILSLGASRLQRRRRRHRPESAGRRLRAIQCPAQRRREHRGICRRLLRAGEGPPLRPDPLQPPLLHHPPGRLPLLRKPHGTRQSLPPPGEGSPRLPERGRIHADALRVGPDQGPAVGRAGRRVAGEHRLRCLGDEGPHPGSRGVRPAAHQGNLRRHIARRGQLLRLHELLPPSRRRSHPRRADRDAPPRRARTGCGSRRFPTTPKGGELGT